jgi:dTMP kinase
MNNTERLERLGEIVDELCEMPDDQVLLVEGAKDRMAMTLAGVNGKMVIVQAEGGPLRVAEKLFNEKLSAIILTDWDPEGEHIAKELEHALSSLCVRYDTRIRARLRSVCGSEIHDVESLPSFYSRLATEAVRRKEGRNI